MYSFAGTVELQSVSRASARSKMVTVKLSACREGVLLYSDEDTLQHPTIITDSDRVYVKTLFNPLPPETEAASASALPYTFTFLPEPGNSDGISRPDALKLWAAHVNTALASPSAWPESLAVQEAFLVHRALLSTDTGDSWIPELIRRFQRLLAKLATLGCMRPYIARGTFDPWTAPPPPQPPSPEWAKYFSVVATHTDTSHRCQSMTVGRKPLHGENIPGPVRQCATQWARLAHDLDLASGARLITAAGAPARDPGDTDSMTTSDLQDARETLLKWPRLAMWLGGELKRVAGSYSHASDHRSFLLAGEYPLVPVSAAIPYLGIAGYHAEFVIEGREGATSAASQAQADALRYACAAKENGACTVYAAHSRAHVNADGKVTAVTTVLERATFVGNAITSLRAAMRAARTPVYYMNREGYRLCTEGGGLKTPDARNTFIAESKKVLSDTDQSSLVAAVNEMLSGILAKCKETATAGSLWWNEYIEMSDLEPLLEPPGATATARTTITTWVESQAKEDDLALNGGIDEPGLPFWNWMLSGPKSDLARWLPKTRVRPTPEAKYVTLFYELVWFLETVHQPRRPAADPPSLTDLLNGALGAGEDYYFNTETAQIKTARTGQLGPGTSWVLLHDYINDHMSTGERPVTVSLRVNTARRPLQSVALLQPASAPETGRGFTSPGWPAPESTAALPPVAMSLYKSTRAGSFVEMGELTTTVCYNEAQAAVGSPLDAHRQYNRCGLYVFSRDPATTGSLAQITEAVSLETRLAGNDAWAVATGVGRPETWGTQFRHHSHFAGPVMTQPLPQPHMLPRDKRPALTVPDTTGLADARPTELSRTYPSPYKGRATVLGESMCARAYVWGDGVVGVYGMVSGAVSHTKSNRVQWPAFSGTVIDACTEPWGDGTNVDLGA